jgi:predicted lipoprotein with Yx(FWY)xxD motif
MRSKKTYTALAALAAVVVLVIAACGGGDDNGAEESASGGTDAATTVSVSNVEGVGDVLVDSEGSALYAAEQEADGMVLCTDVCASIWEPLTVDGGAPTGSDGLAADLGVVTRPEGTQQVTFNGRLLYTFVEDSGPGTVTGNGFADNFGDQFFEWHVATPTGVSTSGANSSMSATGGDYIRP